MDDVDRRAELKRLLEEVDAELGRLDSSVDPAGTDEPEVEPYETRLRGLRDAATAMEGYDQGRAQS